MIISIIFKTTLANNKYNFCDSDKCGEMRAKYLVEEMNIGHSVEEYLTFNDCCADDNVR